MAAGNYSGTKAERDDIRRLRDPGDAPHRTQPRRGNGRNCAPSSPARASRATCSKAATDAIASNRKAWIDTMMEGEYGLSSSDPHPMRAALATFLRSSPRASCRSCRSPFRGRERLRRLGGVHGGGVLRHRRLKARWSLTPWWRSGAETLVIGGVAAGIAYGVGSLFHF